MVTRSVDDIEGLTGPVTALAVPIGMMPSDTDGSIIMPGRCVSWSRWILAIGPASALVQVGQASDPSAWSQVPHQLRSARGRPPVQRQDGQGQEAPTRHSSGWAGGYAHLMVSARDLCGHDTRGTGR